MGMSASKRVKAKLGSSSEFDSACDSTYHHCLSLSQHAFPGVLPYQLFTASTHLHQTLSSASHINLLRKWLPSPPSRAEVDSALRFITRHTNKTTAQGTEEDDELVLGSVQFKEWAMVLFADAIVSNAGKTLISRVPIGIAGIGGIGVVTRSNKDVIGAAIGIYALGVSTAIYLSLYG